MKVFREVRSVPARWKTSSSTNVLKAKPYSFARPKITLTLEDLENSEEDEEDCYEPAETPSGFTSLQGLRPKRSCTKTMNSAYEQSDTSGDERENSNDKSEVNHEQMNIYEEGQPSSSHHIPPEDLEKDFSCRCGSVFENQPDLDDHIMNSSYCYDFYMYHDN